MVDEYAEHCPVADSFYDMEPNPEFIGPISWPIMLAHVSFNGFLQECEQ